jgi:hypothetical protein
MKEFEQADGYYSESVAQHNARMGQSSKNFLPTATRKESPVNTVRDALKQSHELSNYVHSLVNRLCGPQPEDAKQDGIGPSNGILFDVESEAHDAARSMQAAMNALRRLESHLP